MWCLSFYKHHTRVEMKILYYIHSLNVGGAEKIVSEYLINLKTKGIDVSLVVIRHTNSFLEKRVKDAHIKIYALNENCKIQKFNGVKWRINILIGYKKKWNSIIKAEQPDIVHIHTFLDTMNGIDFPNDRMVYTFHAKVERSLTLSSDINKQLLQKFANNGMTFFALNNSAIKDIKNIYSTDKIVKIPNGINIEEIRSKRIDRKRFLEKLEIPTNAFILGHVGRFHPIKNHEKILSVFKALNMICPNSYLMLVGGDVNNRINEIQKKSYEYGIANRIKFLGVCEDATEIISVFDAFILPSYSESFSLVTVEAEALGIRCVVSDEVPQEVVCNDNCFRLKIDESDEKWARLLIDNSTTEKKYKLTDFDMNNVINRMINAYREILLSEPI